MDSEERFRRIEENLLVQAELLNRVDHGLENLEQSVQRQSQLFERQLQLYQEYTVRHDVEMQEFRTSLARVLDLLERYITGQGGGNGFSSS